MKPQVGDGGVAKGRAEEMQREERRNGGEGGGGAEEWGCFRGGGAE